MVKHTTRERGRGNTCSGGRDTVEVSNMDEVEVLVALISLSLTKKQAQIDSRKDVATSGSARNNDKSDGFKRIPVNGKKVVICYECGQKGHYKPECEWNLDYEGEATNDFHLGKVFAISDQFPLPLVLLDNQ